MKGHDHSTDDGQQTEADKRFQPAAPVWRELYYKSGFYSLFYQERRNAVLSLVDQLGLTSARILEVGCGPGITSVALGKRGHIIYAIDTIPAMIELTRKHARESQMERQILATIGEINALGFPDNAFDLAVVVGVTEWLASLEQPLRELARVVRPGGFLVVTGDNTWSLDFVFDPFRNPILAPMKRWANAIMRRFGRESRPSCLLRSVSQMDAAIRGAGLQTVRRATMGFGPFTFAGKNILSDSAGWKLHQSLQVLADSSWPVLRSTGHIYIALVRKPEQS